mmetsp:Transcript_64273/g.103934  ORF Transcript_64273/g.103934 Transcript_64273/m.103934 type:complete len:273 (+) Transcript_64273:92-910(+)
MENEMRLPSGSLSLRRVHTQRSQSPLGMSLMSSRKCASPRAKPLSARLPPLAGAGAGLVSVSPGFEPLEFPHPCEYFLDDEKYCRREVLEENVIDAEMLKRIDFFRSFGQSFLEELLISKESIRKVLLLPNTPLVLEGTPGDSMMVVSKGRVRVSVGGKVVCVLGEGSYFGELVFLGASLTRTATVTTETFCDVRIIYNKSFIEIASKYPELKAALKAFQAQNSKSMKKAIAQKGAGRALTDLLGQVFRKAAKKQAKNSPVSPPGSPPVSQD